MNQDRAQMRYCRNISERNSEVSFSYMIMNHVAAIHRCLELAEHGRGKVGNGVLVGSALIRNGNVIAEGFHEDWGSTHAERQLLLKYEQKISSSDILYVNLEPCCHHGKTPPCTDIIIERGIKIVVYGMKDPDTRVAGKGIEQLKKAGINVIGPVLPEVCARFNRGYISVRTKGRLYITLKKAQMPDGRIANDDGSFLKITNKVQDTWSHTYLRATHDAILIGAKTVMTDDPKLDCRLAEGEKAQYQPYRIVLDPHLHIPENARVVTDDKRMKTIIIYCSASEAIDQKKLQRLADNSIRVIDIDMRDGIFDWENLWEILLSSDDTFHGLTSILVEGGKRTWELCERAGIVDEKITLIGHG